MTFRPSRLLPLLAAASLSVTAGCAGQAPMVEGPAQSSTALAAPAADSNGTFEIGKVVVEGSEVPDADLVAASLEKDLHRCPASGTPATSQQLRVKAKVGPHGEVRFAKTEGAGGSEDNQIASCLASQVAEANFAPPAGTDATVIIPIAVVYR